MKSLFAFFLAGAVPTVAFADFGPIVAKPQKFTIVHSTLFQAEITVKPQVAFSDGKAHVSVILQRRDTVNVPPGGLAEVGWEIKLSGCADDATIQSVTLKFDGGDRILRKGRRSVDDPGGKLFAVIIEYRWEENAKSLTFTNFDAAAEGTAKDAAVRPQPARLATADPKAAAEQLKRKAEEKRKEAVRLRDRIRVLDGELKPLLENINTLTERSRTASDGAARREIGRALNAVLERAEAAYAQRLRAESGARLLEAEAESLMRQAAALEK